MEEGGRMDERQQRLLPLRQRNSQEEVSGVDPRTGPDVSESWEEHILR